MSETFVKMGNCVESFLQKTWKFECLPRWSQCLRVHEYRSEVLNYQLFIIHTAFIISSHLFIFWSAFQIKNIKFENAACFACFFCSVFLDVSLTDIVLSIPPYTEKMFGGDGWTWPQCFTLQIQNAKIHGANIFLVHSTTLRRYI